MPIKGLTGQGEAFPEIGQLRKGDKKPSENQPGKDLDHWRFTSDLGEVEAAFYEAYGKEPRLINVFLPHQTIGENWDAWCEEYTAGALLHRCDGDYVVRMRKEDGSGYFDPPYGTMECPYKTGELVRTEKKPGCTPKGRLKVIIRELNRLAYVMVLTTSWNDIRNLDQQLTALFAIRQDLRGIPLQLRRRPDKISTPQYRKTQEGYERTGKRQRRESWLLSLEAAPDFVDLQMRALEFEARPALPETIEPGTLVVDGRSGEILAGHYDYDEDEDGNPAWDQTIVVEPEPEPKAEPAIKPQPTTKPREAAPRKEAPAAPQPDGAPPPPTNLTTLRTSINWVTSGKYNTNKDVIKALQRIFSNDKYTPPGNNPDAYPELLTLLVQDYEASQAK